MKCLECNNGILHTVKIPYETTDGKGDLFIIENVPHEICDSCGNVWISSVASRMIEDERKKRGVTYNPPRRIKNI